MGIYDRGYMQDGRRGGAGLAGLSVTARLIIANAVLWFLFAGSLSWGGPHSGLFRFIWDDLLLHPDQVFGAFRLWQPFTAIWFHDPTSLGHAFFNMLFLFFFGRHVEAGIGARAYLRLYVMAGVVGSLAFVLFALATGEPGPALGASGAVYGIGVFLALRQPHLQVIFFVIRMPLWVLVGVFMVGQEVVNLAILHRDPGATVAHLAGAAYGLLHHWAPRLSLPRPARRPPPPPERPEAVQARVDLLLDKISREGIGALTESEKAFLEQASRRYGR